MDQYIGVKVIKAEPMNSIAAEELFGRKIGPGIKDGYLVEYDDGYQSWSPKDVFEKAYQHMDGMTFGVAIEAMKNGHRIARNGWNGKDMFLRIVVPGGDNKDFDLGCENLPYIELKTADNKLVPWVANHTDLLAIDWYLVD